MPVASIVDYKNNRLYSTIGYVTSDYTTVSTAGSGFLIAPDMVLTAAHNVMFDEIGNIPNTKKEIAKQVGFYLNYDHGRVFIPVQYCTSRIPEQWKVSFNEDYDFAVLFLPKSLSDIVLGLTEIQSTDPLPIDSEVVGYPGMIVTKAQKQTKNKPVSRYSSPGEIVQLSACKRKIWHNCFTWSGNSGGPIAVHNGKTKKIPFCAGVHTTGVKNYLNSGVHCTDHMLQYIKKWSQEKQAYESSRFQRAVENTMAKLTKSNDEKRILHQNRHLFENYSEIDLEPMMRLFLAGRRS